MTITSTNKHGIENGHTPIIEMKNLTKVYRMGEMDVKALDSVNLKIFEKEFVALVGPSGSGKSTMMNMIGLLDVPTAGECFLNGVEIGSLSDNQLAVLRNKTIGFIFQQFNLLPKLTALENVELPTLYMGMHHRERKQRAKEALIQVGLGDRLKHLPTELSGGQQQRVAIARALVTNPPVILADEPTGNLDSHSGHDVLELLDNLHSEGNTILLITHDNYVAEKAQRIVRLADGEIISDTEWGEGRII